MPLLLLLVVLAVLAAIAVVAAGRGDSLGTSSPDRSPSGELPVEGVDRAAVKGLRFSLAFRGYRMDEVDDVLDRLASELETRDHRIAELESASDQPGPVRLAELGGRGDHPDPPADAGRRDADAGTEA